MEDITATRMKREMKESRLRKDKYLIAFSGRKERWEIKNKTSKNVLFSFESEGRAKNFLEKLFNYPFRNDDNDK